MWSPIVLCFLVGFAFAANNPGWKNGSEYVYSIRGHSLVSHKEISNQQSGFVFKAKLRIQPQNDGKLRAQIVHPEYDEIHTELNRWNAHIPDEKLSWKPLKMSGKPFELDMEQGRIVGLWVSKNTPVWEVNMIKSFMSQFQINTDASNLIENDLNTLPENGDGDNDAVYTAMEDTVTGNTATLYQIRPLPAHLVQADPEEAEYVDEDGEVIEVIKNKNYENSLELPAYTYGFEGLKGGKPAGNHMGEIFSRQSTSRILLTGSLKRFVIRKSFTANEIHVSPTLSSDKSSLASSIMNATLIEIKSQEQQIPEVPQPILLESLVYSYEKPFAGTNEIEARPSNKYRQNEDFENLEESRTNWISRSPRSLRRFQQNNQKHGFKQELSALKDAPKSPLLPFTMGYEGMSIKNKIDTVAEVEKLAKEIGQRMQKPEQDHHEELLDMFSTMVSLIRVMDAEELHKVANQLYTNNEQGVEHAVWSAYKDGVAHSGTGPALLVINDWIKSDKIRGEDASQAVTATIESARQPTVNYCRTLFELAKSPKVEKQWPLNDTILLGFADLLRKVYVDDDALQGRFPVQSFKPLRTEEGKQFMEREVLPYFEQQLQDAIKHAQTHKIHTVIRTIGTIGSYHILPVFQPYLNGRVHVSQFQRVLMVLALNKLVETDGEAAQNVLLRLYQNPGESREVRIAAVFQLMRTNPDTEILQSMAQYTNIDDDDYVNAVVKSSIQTAAQLDTPDTQEFAQAARIAEPLLTEKIYGYGYGGNYLRTYFIEQMERSYKQTLQLFGSDDSMIPNGFRYNLRKQMGGLKSNITEMHAMVSSFDDLVQVGKEQFKRFDRQQQEQKQHSQEQEQNQWSSQNIAKLLNLETDDAKQLEGFLLFKMGNYRNMFAFDNRTVEGAAEFIRKIEQELREQKPVSFFKLMTREMAVSVPTEIGIPFLFTYDVPMFIKAQGTFKASAQPQLSQNGKLQVPEQIELKADMRFTVSTKVQSRLSVTAPFNHKQYFAGFDKHWQVNVPARLQVQFDVKNMNAEIEFEPTPKKEFNILHYATRPYTSQAEIANFQPLSANSNTKVIKQDDLQAFETTVGKKSTGMAFHVEFVHSRQFFSTLDLSRMLRQQNNFVDTLQSLWDDNTVQYGSLNVNYNPQQSWARKAVLRLSYEQKYKSQPSSGSASEWILNEDAQPSQRQEELMQKVAADIKNVHVVALDSTLEFKGQQKLKYILTGAVAKSNVDPKSRVMITYKRSSDGTSKPHEFHFVAKSYIPNTNALDAEYSLHKEPMAETEIKVKFGNSQEPLAKIEAQLKYRRSEERSQYLKELPMYRQCKEESRAGNKQMPACLNMTMIANLLDSVDLKAHYENLQPGVAKTVERYFHALQVLAEPYVNINEKDSSVAENEVRVHARFHPDLQALNVTVKAQNQETKFANIEIDEVTQQILVVHPVFHVYNRLSAYLYSPEGNYRDSCVVDKSQINTFSNQTYSADISKHWTVMLQYVANYVGNSERNQPSVYQQLKSQPENYVVLVRENPEASNKKDIKIVVSTPQSDYQIQEIEMTPYQGSELKAKVTVNGQQVRVSEKESHDVKGGYIQIYALPNGEVKVEVHRAFYVIYDGARARITSTQGKFKNNVVGVCGQFTDHEADDLTTPQGCVARDAEEFVRSYEVEGQKGKQIRDIFKGQTNKCVDKESPLFVRVVSPRDYRKQPQFPAAFKTCTFFQTKYVEKNGQTCFTVRAQPTCNEQCRPTMSLTKNVPVHCVDQDSKVAKIWKKQIDEKKSPDFSGQRAHKTVPITVPQSCSQ
ncbi:unnamed protein product [Phyllotreta striolata]|uniref:Vitellogenin n=1 Tax=Phyllotreta striolata TaxID=444603 RepID=A0A9N9XKG0_PHYSR|nr:unnamed protein product [Phyllotreta striolata]